MKVYVINLAGSTARWKKIVSQLEDGKLKYVRIDAVDGRTLENVQQHADQEACLRYMGRKLQPGEIGCFLSHLRALGEFLNSSEERAIILEDDAILLPGFHRFLQWSEACRELRTAALVNLGPSDYKYASLSSQNEEVELLVAHRFPMLATGIFWTRQGAEEMVGAVGKISMPYDNFLRFHFTGSRAGFSLRPSILRSDQVDSDINQASLTRKRSAHGRHPLYFFIRQKRMLREKVQAMRALLQYRYSRFFRRPSGV
jgi:glycosyl transferase family 25